MTNSLPFIQERTLFGTYHSPDKNPVKLDACPMPIRSPASSRSRTILWISSNVGPDDDDAGCLVQAWTSSAFSASTVAAENGSVTSDGTEEKRSRVDGAVAFVRRPGGIPPPGRRPQRGRWVALGAAGARNDTAPGGARAARRSAADGDDNLMIRQERR